MNTLKKFLKKKSNIAMVVMIAVILIGGLIGGSFIRKETMQESKKNVAMTNEVPEKENEESISEEKSEEADSMLQEENEDEVKENDISEDDSKKEENSKKEDESETENTSKKEETSKEENGSEKEETPKKENVSKKEDTSKKEDAAKKEDTSKKQDTTKKEDTSKKEETTKKEETAKKEDTSKKEEVVEVKKTTCTISIYCDSILSNMDKLKAGKEGLIPSDGCILKTMKVEITEGETVLDVLAKACNKARIQLEYSYSPAYGSYYVEGINNIYEFDCGSSSGWKYKVNGSYPNYGCSSYKLSDGDVIVWTYTCTG